LSGSTKGDEWKLGKSERATECVGRPFAAGRPHEREELLEPGEARREILGIRDGSASQFECTHGLAWPRPDRAENAVDIE
jgi:hypothetical protein